MGILDRDFKPVLAVLLHSEMRKRAIGEKVGRQLADIIHGMSHAPSSP